MVRLDELEEKEVINIRDGARLGYVFDLEMDLACGKICAFFVSCPAKFFGLGGRDTEYRVPWDMIYRIGCDFILVDLDPPACLCQDPREKRWGSKRGL